MEDNDRLRLFVRGHLERAGYAVCEAASGKAALGTLHRQFLDLVLLDLGLGDMSGMEILKTIRRQDEALPVIIVSSAGEQAPKVEGLTIGCDDYITKPFYVDELLLRVKRVLHRARVRQPGSTIVSDTLTIGPFELNPGTLSVTKRGLALEMRKKLFDLLLFFARHPDSVLSFESLHHRAWAVGEELNENSLYVHIRELRKLIEDDPSDPRFIRTVRGLGYLFTVQDCGEGSESPAEGN